MSVNWDATLIIGCKIDDPYVTVKERGCHHQETEGKFCSECGKPTWIEHKSLSPILEQFDNIYGKEGSITFIRTCGGNRYYCGIYIGRVNYDNMDRKIDMSKFRDKDTSVFFYRILKNLYKPENFGVWLVMDAG
jgi:hypothetical protein